jgi:hypothetical protein
MWGSAKRKKGSYKITYLTKLSSKSILFLEVFELVIGNLEVEECWTVARTTAALGHDGECRHATRVVIANVFGLRFAG